MAWRRMFSALQHANYRLFAAGMLLSLVGTWIQFTAEGWLVYELTGSPFYLGLIRFLHAVPVTALTLLAGAVADRADKRRILVATQTASMVLAFLFFVLVWRDWIQLWQVAALAVLLGTAQAFDIPTRQSFVVDMVGRRDLMNAIALNSSIFNGARIVGPALAGIFIALPFVGLSGCFLLNALSFLAVIVAYRRMKLPTRPQPAPTDSLRQATREAWRHVLRDPLLRLVMGLVSLFSLFGLAYTALMPVFAAEILGGGARTNGLLLAANGAGAFLGALTLAALGDYPRRRRLFVAAGCGTALMLMAFSASRWMPLSLTALAFGGWFMILFFSSANTLVQFRVPDALRGRVMGIYSFCFIGLSPFGNLLGGSLARWTSAPVAVGLGTGCCLVGCLLAAALFWRLPESEKG